MAIAHAQGLVVTFDGVTAQDVISCNVSGGGTSTVDATPLNAAVIGTGKYTRCAKSVMPGSVEPNTVTVTMLGVGLPFSGDDRGKVAALTVSKAGIVNYSGNAVLLSNDTNMSAGEFPQQTVSFSYLN